MPIAAATVWLPLTVAAITGNLDIPQNDAWSYSRIAGTFARTGTIHLLGWNRTSLIGQVVMLGPLGRWLVVQQATVSVLALAVLYCVYDLVRVTTTPQRAAFAALLVGLWPGFGLLATSFMTDIPYLAGTFAALAVGRRALVQDQRSLFWLSLTLGLWAGTIRDQAIAAPFAVLAYALLSNRSRTNVGFGTVIAGGMLFALSFGAFAIWRGALPNGDHPPTSLAIDSLAHQIWLLTPQVYFTLAAALGPAVFLTARPTRWRAGSWLASAIVALLAIHLRADHIGFTVGNYLTAARTFSGATPTVRDTLWDVIVWLAIISGMLMAGTIVERWRRAEPVLRLFTAITVIGTIAVGAAGQGIFDRYLLVLAPGVLAVVLAPASQSHGRPGIRELSGSYHLRVTAAAIATVSVATASALIAAYTFNWHIARWHAGQAVAATGVPASRIDAGLEWLGWHSPAGVIDRYPKGGYGSAGYFSKRPACVVLTPASFVPHGRAERGWLHTDTYHFRTYLVFGISQLYVYHTRATGCPR